MTVTDGCALAIGLLFMLLIVTMIGVDDVLQFTYLVFEMDGLDFGFLETCSYTSVT